MISFITGSVVLFLSFFLLIIFIKYALSAMPCVVCIVSHQEGRFLFKDKIEKIKQEEEEVRRIN